MSINVRGKLSVHLHYPRQLKTICEDTVGAVRMNKHWWN